MSYDKSYFSFDLWKESFANKGWRLSGREYQCFFPNPYINEREIIIIEDFYADRILNSFSLEKDWKKIVRQAINIHTTSDMDEDATNKKRNEALEKLYLKILEIEGKPLLQEKIISRFELMIIE